MHAWPSRFACAGCGAEVIADASMESTACPACATWFHAARCTNCPASYIAIGNGTLVCPRCGASQRLVAGTMRTFGDVGEPLATSVSALGVRTRVPPDLDAVTAPLAVVLYAAAVFVLMGGALSVAVGYVLSSAHASSGNVASGVAEVLGPTIVVTLLLTGVAHLVEHVRVIEGELRALSGQVPLDADPPTGGHEAALVLSGRSQSKRLFD